MLEIAPENCLVVEDADAGIIAGKRANMKTLAVNSAKGGDFYAQSLENVNIHDLIKDGK